MAKIRSRILKFSPSPSQDLDGYKVYVEPASTPTNLNYESPSEFIGFRKPIEGDNITVDLSTLGVLRNAEGSFDLGVAAVDDNGNESNMSRLLDVELNFIAPLIPGALEIA